MARMINCEDGVVIRGEDDAQLLAAAWAHLRAAHPDLVSSFTDEQLLALATEG